GRRARDLFGAVGRANQGFYGRDDPDRALAAGAWGNDAETARRALRLGLVRRLAGRSPRGSRGARRRDVGVAAARHRRFRLRSDVHAGWFCAYLRRDDQPREARPAAAGPWPVAPRPRLRQACGDLPCAALRAPTL